MAHNPCFDTARYGTAPPEPDLVCVYCLHDIEAHDQDVPECCIYSCWCTKVLFDDGPFE